MRTYPPVVLIACIRCGHPRTSIQVGSMEELSALLPPSLVLKIQPMPRATLSQIRGAPWRGSHSPAAGTGLDVD